MDQSNPSSYDSIVSSARSAFYPNSTNKIYFIAYDLSGKEKCISTSSQFEEFLEPVFKNQLQAIRLYSFEEENKNGLEVTETEMSSPEITNLEGCPYCTIYGCANDIKSIKKRLANNKEWRRPYKAKQGPFLIKKNHCNSKLAMRRDLIPGLEKYLMTNFDRYKKKIPPLLNDPKLWDKLIEVFYFAKGVVKECFPQIRHLGISAVRVSYEAENKSFRLKFKTTYKHLKDTFETNKTVSLYKSGVDPKWTQEETLEKMKNFLRFATIHIEKLVGPISLSDF